ncbi:helix-turn-helix transcriptional regulator [Patulibacter minatonensis]|uniref:helix-turn-helix transcriptional regulator n=1 Tax=Patulibacter minatonensis TaxID=298163 RepID=UPI000685FB7F|nr:LuxR C-terminal-related transcriptional regulator [Patulibacter minatonensis]
MHDGDATLADRLQRAAAGCAAAIGAGADPAAADPDDRRTLRGLVVRLHRQAQLVDELELQARATRITDCQRGLARLRACTSTQALVGSVCEEVTRSCGLERVLLSRVEDGRWWPWVVNAAVEPESWVASWRERSIPLDELTIETRLLREHRSELITDTTHRGIHEIIREGRSTSYVVAPIAPAGRVIGFFHADHRVGGPPCDATDRDVLWRFAEGFGHLFERTALSERLHGRRKEVDEMLDVVHDAMTQLTAVELRLSAGAEADDPAPASDRPDVLDSLTPRERDVLRLLVAGRRNREIAEQLVISEATVKSHVKQLLRKHGVANRSQVIARHHGA